MILNYASIIPSNPLDAYVRIHDTIEKINGYRRKVIEFENVMIYRYYLDYFVEIMDFVILLSLYPSYIARKYRIERREDRYVFSFDDYIAYRDWGIFIKSIEFHKYLIPEEKVGKVVSAFWRLVMGW